MTQDTIMPKGISSYSHVSCIILLSPLVTNTTISLPFTYYQDSRIQQSRTAHEKISARLDEQAKRTLNELNHHDFSSSLQNHAKSTVHIDNKSN